MSDSPTVEIPSERPMKCGLCGGTTIDVLKDIGWDINEGGEERQHLDQCRDCGAKRLWADVIDYQKPPSTWWGPEWSKTL